MFCAPSKPYFCETVMTYFSHSSKGGAGIAAAGCNPNVAESDGLKRVGGGGCGGLPGVPDSTVGRPGCASVG